ncbi:MAG TPA: hypothetical protein VFP84_17130 [Kofleriaceae bacterium]|nr:hypothetical protein [Kofleriaceae bacterium]
MNTLVRLTVATLIPLAAALAPATAQAQAPAQPAPDGAPPAAPDAQPPSTPGSAPAAQAPDNAPPSTTSAAPTPMAEPATKPKVEPPKGAEWTSLRILHDKGIISDDELAAAIKDIGITGAGDATTLVVSKIKATIYGFAQADFQYQSTQACTDFCSNTQVPRDDTYKGNHGRTLFSPRDSRFGFRVAAPEEHGIKSSGLLEGDFEGPTATSEQGTFVNPVFRIRHAYLKFETPYVDILMGQTWSLFGWQSNFLAASVQLPGLPGQLFERTTQFRVSKTIKSEPVNVELAIAANRAPQQDSAYPEGVAGIKVNFNKWTGQHTSYLTATTINAASIAISGDLRGFRFPEFTGAPRHGITKMGGGVTFDVFLPIIPATKTSKDNALAITGELVIGAGTSDAYTALGAAGTANATLRPPVGGGPAPVYTPNWDPGLAVVDANGNFELVKWTTYTVAAEYYVPHTEGRLGLLANFQHSESPNAKDIGAAAVTTVTTAAQQAAARARVRDHEELYELGIFGDPTHATRLGLSGSMYDDTYGDGKDAKNYVVLMSGFIFF